MRRLVLALAATLMASSAFASDEADVTAAIRHYNDDFTKGDTKAEVALCTSQAIVIDDFAPHAWQGPTACLDWATAVDALDKSDGDTNVVVTLGKPWHVAVTGDRAYAVYPSHLTYKHKGKPVAEEGVWTFAMQKTAAGWRIAGWAWAQH